MFRHRIRLDTMSDVERLADVASKFSEHIVVSDTTGRLVVSAKSVLGLVYSKMEWKEIYLLTEYDHYTAFRDFIIEDSEGSAE